MVASEGLSMPEIGAGEWITGLFHVEQSRENGFSLEDRCWSVEWKITWRSRCLSPMGARSNGAPGATPGQNTWKYELALGATCSANVPRRTIPAGYELFTLTHLANYGRDCWATPRAQADRLFTNLVPPQTYRHSRPNCRARTPKALHFQDVGFVTL